MINKAMIEIWSKFQFQILFQFYWTAEKVTEIRLAMVMVECFDKYYHLFNLQILVTFLFFHDCEYKDSLTEPIKFSQ